MIETNRFMQIKCFLLLIFSNFQGFSQDQTNPLFQKKDVLQIKIEANLKVLLKDRGQTPQYHWAKLSYVDDQGNTVAFPIKAKVRGNFRRSATNCSFPPLLLNFPKKEVKNTLFDHQDKLKLVTECVNEDLVFHEYLAYEIYNILTDFSFRARLTEVTYIDSLGKKEPDKEFGILLENETDVAKRNAAKNTYMKNVSSPQYDTIQMLTAVIFEYMIANNDWSVPALHNIKQFTKTGKLFLAVPYDFDHSGVVEANYALPPPQLEIASVRERLYRGLDYPPSVFQQVFDKFNSVKPQIYALYQGNPLLSASYIKRTLKYFDEFYEDINDPKAIPKHFTAGRNKN
jgi:hypothetical protein